VRYAGTMCRAVEKVLSALLRVDLVKGHFLNRAFTYGNRKVAGSEQYLALFEEARSFEFPETRAIEDATGFRLEDDWLEKLALSTQVVVKQSELNWQHGRLLYSHLSQMIEKRRGEGFDNEPIMVLETGTARGYSSLCLARALIDSTCMGTVVTIDALPHHKEMYWNCIEDVSGKQSRRQLLARWESELARIVFVEGTSRGALSKLGLSRVHFAFLDAQHTYREVLEEFRYVRERQNRGDVVFFDDVTRGKFDGVVQAVEEIEKEGLYAITYMGHPTERGYALGVRL